jgi:hypothetical protein
MDPNANLEEQLTILLRIMDSRHAGALALANATLSTLNYDWI